MTVLACSLCMASAEAADAARMFTRLLPSRIVTSSREVWLSRSRAAIAWGPRSSRTSSSTSWVESRSVLVCR